MVSAGLEEFLQPDGLAVIEWAERMEEGKFRRARIEIVSETERRIIYDDIGA